MPRVGTWTGLAGGARAGVSGARPGGSGGAVQWEGSVGGRALSPCRPRFPVCEMGMVIHALGALPAPGSLSLTASSPGSTVAIRYALSLCGFLYPPRVCPWSAHLFHMFSRTTSAGAGRPGLLISAFTLVPRLCDLPGPTPASVVFCALGGRRVLCSGFSGAHVGAGSRGRLCAAAASW